MYIRSFAVALLLVVTGNASAQEPYPARPVRIVIPYPPGGGTDLQGRPMAQKLTEKWGQNAVIDNRGGAGGMVGAEIVAKSKPDGYTILMCASGEVSLNVALFPKMAYDPERDLIPVTQLSISPLVLVVHPSLPAKSVKELIALARSRPGQLTFASAGVGTAPHLSAELFRAMAGINMVHIPYKGSPPAVTDLLAGEVALMFSPASTVLNHVKSGRLRALAVTTASRLASLPELPTVAETGMKGYETITWFGFVAPAKTPHAVVARLNAEIVKVLSLPDVRQQFANQGIETYGGTPEHFANYIREEIEKWAKVIKISGASAN